MRYDDVCDKKVRRIGVFTHQSDHRRNQTAFPCRMICSACGNNLHKLAGTKSMTATITSKPYPNLTKGTRQPYPRAT